MKSHVLSPIPVDRLITKKLLQQYKETSSKELLTILAMDGHYVPEHQHQTTDAVSFNEQVIGDGVKQLATDGYKTDIVAVAHSHNRHYGHGFALSQADLDTAQHLYDTQGRDHNVLVMNGHETSRGDIVVQHAIVTDHTGEMYAQTGEQGEGSVLTIYTDSSGKEQRFFSDSIQEAEKKERVMQSFHEIVQQDSRIQSQEIALLKEMLMAA